MTQRTSNYNTTLIFYPINVFIPCFPFLLSSASGWHLECYRGFSRERPQHHGPQRRALCGSSRNGTVHHFLPAEQTHAHHPPDQRGAVHQPAAQLPAGCLWPVSNPSRDTSAAWLCTYTSEVLTWANVVWNVTLEVSARGEWKYRLFTLILSHHASVEWFFFFVCVKLKAKLNIF